MARKSEKSEKSERSDPRRGLIAATAAAIVTAELSLIAARAGEPFSSCAKC